MRKMKNLIKLRNKLIPWSNWGIIQFLLNTLCLVSLIISLCFTGITQLASTLFLVIMAQYIPVFIVMTLTWIVQSLLCQNTLKIIKRKLEELNLSIKISVDDFTSHSCAVYVNYEENVSYEIAIKDILHKMNRNLGNGYTVMLVEMKAGEK